MGSDAVELIMTVEDFRLEEVLGFCSGPRSEETTILKASVDFFR
jgi:hypothetical protein